jgi:hypothetical protein
MFTACVVAEGDGLATPVIQAHAGDPVRLHVFGAFNEQNQVFSIEGHEWPLKPAMAGADLMSSSEFGSSENLDIVLEGGAGGPFHLVGDYVWQNHRMPYTQAGQWGYLRVLPAGDRRVLPLNRSGVGSQTAEAPIDGTPAAQSGEPVPGPVSMLDSR